MQTLLFLAIVVVLVAVVIEDFRSRTVHVFWFPVLFALAFAYAIQFETGEQAVSQILISSVFLLLQGCMLVAYFVVKHKRWINITALYLGWGDIIFIIAVLPFFSSFMFVLFYLSSLLLTILFVVCYRFTGKKMVFIPLAGIQSMCLLLTVIYHHCIESVLFKEMYLPQML